MFDLIEASNGIALDCIVTLEQLAEPPGSQYAGTAVGGHEIHILSLIWDMSFETY